MNIDQPNFPHDWEINGDVLVAITAPGTIDTATWNKFIESLKKPEVRKVLNFVRGEVTIDAVKRKQAADTVTERKLEVTVVTDNRLTRGVLTAVSWLGANIKAYSWSDMEKALDRIGASPTDRSRILQVAEAFRTLRPE